MLTTTEAALRGGRWKPAKDSSPCGSLWRYPMPARYFLRIAGVVVGAVIAGLLALPAAVALGDVWSRTVLGAQWTGLDWDIGRVLSAIGMLILAWLVLLGLDEKIRQWMSEK